MTEDITIIKASNKDEKSLEVCLQEDAVQDQAKSARDLFSNLQNELDELDDDFKDGLSYLDMKNDTLLSYMIDLCNIVLRKVRNETISGHASVERTVYYRVILEKIKAIDQRLAYQLNKVISLPSEGAETSQGVNIGNLDIEIESDAGSNEQEADDNSEESEQIDDGSEDEEDGDEDDEFGGSVNDEEEEREEDDEFSDIDDDTKTKMDPKSNRGPGIKDKKAVGVYKPPKLRSVAFNDGKGSKKNPKRRQELEDYFQDLESDDNSDIVDETNVHRDLERTRYEEENYTRLPGTNPKKAKRKLREQSKQGKGKKKFKGNNKRKNKW